MDLAGEQFLPDVEMMDDDGHVGIVDDELAQNGIVVRDHNVIGNMTIGQYRKKWEKDDNVQHDRGMSGYNQYMTMKDDEKNEAVKIIKEANKSYSLKPVIDYVNTCKALEKNLPSLNIDSRKSFSSVIELHKELSETIVAKLMQIRSNRFGELFKDKRKFEDLLTKVTSDLNPSELKIVQEIRELDEERKAWDNRYKMFINRSLTNDIKSTFKKMEVKDIPKALKGMGLDEQDWQVEKVYTYARKAIEEEECKEEQKTTSKETRYYCIGRFVCNSIQSMPKAHRAIIFPDFIELDLSIAGPTAFLDLGMFFFPQMVLRSLKRYITDADNVRAEIVQENKRFIENNPKQSHNRMVDKKSVKDQLRNYMYNSSPLEYQCQLFQDIVQQARDVVDAIDKKELFMGIKKYIIETSPPTKDKKLARNSFAALLSQTYESNLIHQVIKRRLDELNIQVHIQLFDGLYIHKNSVSDIKSLQDDINDAIQDRPVYMFSEEAKELIKISKNGNFRSNMRVKIKQMETIQLPTWQERSLVDMGVPEKQFNIDTVNKRLVDGTRPTIPFETIYNTKYNVIAAAMKSGKTYYTNAFINWVVRHYPTTTILIISNRVSQAEVASSRFKIKDGDSAKQFFMYNTRCKTKGCKKNRGVCVHTRDVMIQEKYIVCQWESLHHLCEINKHFTCVVLDEHLSIACQSVSETNAEMAYSNYWYYKYVSEHATCNLYLDDDILSSRISCQFIKITLDPNFVDTRFYVYTQRAMKRSYVIRDMDRQYRMLAKDVDEIRKNKDYKIGLVFSSKRELLICRDMLLKMDVDPALILQIHADLPEAEKNSILKSLANEETRVEQIFMYTSVITTGKVFFVNYIL